MVTGVINGAEEARQAVRQRYKDGSDCIKITATGGVLSIAKNGKAPQFQEDELEAIIKTAKDYGYHVAAHAHGAEGIKRAAKAGVTTIEHGTFMDDEAIEIMKQKGTYLVATILAGKTVADSAKVPGYYHPLVVPKALKQDTYPKYVWKSIQSRCKNCFWYRLWCVITWIKCLRISIYGRSRYASNRSYSSCHGNSS
jgi:predicted amidohydrolase YtcJ